MITMIDLISWMSSWGAFITEMLFFYRWILVAIAVFILFVMLGEFYSSSSFDGIKPTVKETLYLHYSTFTEKFYEEELEKFPSNIDKPEVYLSVVVPSYNEEKRLPIMLDEAIEYLENNQKKDPSYSYEIIIVDDGSKDKTSETGQRYARLYTGDKVRLLKLTQNRGKGAAVCMGVMSSRGKYILMADADGATKFSDLEKLEVALKDITSSWEDLGVACGSRAHMEKEAIAKRSWFRTVLMKGFHACVRVLGGVRGVRDTQCGFKLFTRRAALAAFGALHVHRWCFDVELLYAAQVLGVRCVEVAVCWTEVEGSKLVPVLSWIQMGRDLLLIRLHYLLGIWTVKTKKLN